MLFLFLQASQLRGILRDKIKVCLIESWEQNPLFQKNSSYNERINSGVIVEIWIEPNVSISCI